MTTCRSHVMPFGAEVRPDGVLFQLWAPGATAIELALEQDNAAPALFPMIDGGDGWHRLFSSQAGAGCRYYFRIDHHLLVPDPASRCQAEDIHGPSVVVDPCAFSWRDGSWRGRPWEEAIIYELHIGAFSPNGRFSGVIERLDYLVELGVTAIELMPVADFPGKRNWGYDGVLPFAPDRTYGAPEELKSLVQEAHGRNLMVVLDVVYNHFGPDGNYLHVYAKNGFFNQSRHTPWGAAINFDGELSTTVRRFFLENALYWLAEYHLDGLRLDAVHAIADQSTPHILEDIAQAVRNGPGRDRHVHLILENDGNECRYLRRQAGGAPPLYQAQWNDDFHHCCHVLLTGETLGYYQDYAAQPLRLLGRCLAEGFAYQGELSAYRGGLARGERSDHLPPTAFVAFLQNHDQIGNRALGERLGALTSPRLLHMATALLLLAPSPPLLFMGEEFGATSPFLYFCDFGPDLAGKVRNGRRHEFSRFPAFAAPEAQASIPDPNASATFLRSRLDWQQAASDNGRHWLWLYRTLLALRREHIIPRLVGLKGKSARYTVLGDGGLHVCWTWAGGTRLDVLVNFSTTPLPHQIANDGVVLYAVPALKDGRLPPLLQPQSILWLLGEKKEAPHGG